MSAMIELVAENLAVSYKGNVALEIDSLKHQGNVFGFIGHNGSGKSTSIKTILQLLAPDRGTFYCKELCPDLSSDLNSNLKLAKNSILVPEQHMAYSPETGAVFSDVKIIDYVKLWCRIKHGDSRYYLKDGAKFIDTLLIEPLFNKLGRELSKGQRRRVQTAVGFLCNPRLFLFDEPFDGLDIQQSSYISDLLSDAAKSMAVIVSSHRMDVVERICDVVVVLDNGKVTTSGSVEDVCSALANKSIFIEGLTSSSEAEQLKNNLLENLPNAYVSHIGTQIRVVGKSATAENIKKSINNDNLKISSGPTSLVDAMSYHLKTQATPEII